MLHEINVHASFVTVGETELESLDLIKGSSSLIDAKLSVFGKYTCMYSTQDFYS